MRDMRFAAAILSVPFILQSAASRADDWPQYRGPNQDGISTEKANVKWGAAGPKVIWKVPVDKGFSSFAVSGGKVLTQVIRGGETPREVCLALDAATGKELWFADIGVGKGYSGGG